MVQRKYLCINKEKMPPLSKASHKIGLNKKPVSDKNPSQWVWAYAMLKFKQHQRVTIKEVVDALNYAQVEEAIAIMLEDGTLDMTFSEEKNDFVYFLTEKGLKNVDNV